MKKLLFTQAIILILVSSWSLRVSAQCASTANVYAFNYAGKTYELIKELKSWPLAAACAVQRGGYLVQIDDSAEQVAVYAGIVASGIPTSYHTVSEGGGASYVWTGATDKSLESKWIWDGDNNTTGVNFFNGQGTAGAGGGSVTAGHFANWGGKSTGSFNEPDDFMGKQDAAGIALASWPYGVAGEWNDIDTTNTLYYVIEYDHKLGVNNTINTPTPLSVYPNPAGSVLNISLPTESKGETVQIINTLGQTVSSVSIGNESSIQIIIENLTAGIYIVALGDQRVRFVK